MTKRFRSGEKSNISSSSQDNASIVTQKAASQQLHAKDSIQLNLSLVVKDTTTEVDSTTPDTTKACIACGCDRTNLILENSLSIHYAALRCGGCDCFKGWLPKPQTLKRRQDQRKIIEKLLGQPNLSSRNRKFCESLKGALLVKKKLSSRQVEILFQIAAEHGGVA